MPRWAQCGFHKKRTRRRYAERVFLHPVGFAAHEVHSAASGAGNVDALFFVLEWSHCCFHKKCGRTRYAELVFLHPVGSVGHILHSSAFGARNVNALFFMLSGPDVVSKKCMPGHVTPNLCFYF
jgi:hypothetical protein